MTSPALPQPLPPFRLLPVGVFFVLAVAISFGLTRLPALPGLDPDWLAGLGPLLSGLLCYRLLETPNALGITVAGPRPVLVAGGLLLVGLTYVLTRGAGQPPGAAALFVGSQLLYCLGEEFGWRHYLLNATAGLPRSGQALLTAGLWLSWHFSFMADPWHTMFGNNTALPPLLLAPLVVLALALASLGLADLTRRTQALALPAVLHFATKANTPTLLLALGLCLALAWLQRRPAAARPAPAG